MRTITEEIPERGDKLIEYDGNEVVHVYVIKWVELANRTGNVGPARKVHAESGRGTADLRTAVEWVHNLEWWSNPISDEVRANGKHWARQLTRKKS